MKTLPLITALILTMVASALHAQTTLLIQPGDTVPGVTTNARLSWINGVTINEFDGYAFQGFSIESTSRTNISIITNRSVTSFFTNVLTSNSLITFRGIVTNTVIATNRWNVNGTTNTYVSRIPQILFQTNGPTNSATFTRHTPQGLTSVTNVTILTNRWVSMTGITNYTGIWATGGASNALGLIAKSGDVAPGTSNSNNFVSFSSPVYNNASAVAFIGYVRPVGIVTNGQSTNGLTNAGTFTPTTSGIWTTQPFNGSNALTMVAIAGSPAPGTSANFSFFNSITIPDAGGVIFQATAGTNTGIWAQNASGVLSAVAISGQSLQVGATNKVIRSLSMSTGGWPGPIRSVNQDTGTIIYQAWFTDNTSAWMKVRR
ncbi:MAG: choice-of-anchor tandem repeat NxxGxxAF-containing protein [Chthoniobacterales bacterium]